MLSKDKSIVLVAVVICFVVLGGMMVYIGQGNIRHVSISWQEKIEQTVAFEDINGHVQLKGISGIDGEPNPYLVTRTNFAYMLTVINNGDKHHRLYIEGLNVQTDLLEPGQQDTLTIYPTKEGIYKYYDKQQGLESLGYLEVRTVIPRDEFTGFFRDLI
ncbi:MAG: hypothetical protein HYZ55_04485 [Nitrosarchaeum sp.]|nr:hypothetical protein [Nitrosarchaeum sp.]